MKCKTIQSALGGWAKDFNKVEQDINTWLQAHPDAKVFSLSQVPVGTQTILTTILYD